jgi:5-methyltetrahydrofolate--homocysteine methyltransferase
MTSMSALLTTTAPKMAETIRALEAIDLRDQIKVIPDGAPVDPDFADEMAADGDGSNARSGRRESKGSPWGLTRLKQGVLP